MKILLFFKAGIMRQDSATGSVSADSRKGWILITMEEDELIRLYWMEREAGQETPDSSKLDCAEESLVLFPEDAEFSHLKDKPGRIFLLKFMTSSKRLFFWMQEPSTEKDDYYCSTINNLVSGLSLETDNLNEEEKVPMETSESLASPSNGQRSRKSFADLLNLPALIDFVKENSDLHGRLKELLPSDYEFNSVVEMEKTIRSPYFQQSLRMFDYALENGHLANLLHQFGIPLDPTLLNQFNSKSGSEIFLLSILRKFKK